MKRIWLAVAENDDNGNPSGKATCYYFEDILKFETGSFNGYGFKRYHAAEKTIRISGVEYHYSKHINWYGNMMWNAYLITSTDAVKIINQLNASGKWFIEEADSELYGLLEAKKELTEEVFLRILEESESYESDSGL